MKRRKYGTTAYTTHGGADTTGENETMDTEDLTKVLSLRAPADKICQPS